MLFIKALVEQTIDAVVCAWKVRVMKDTAIFDHLSYGRNCSGLFYIFYLTVPLKTAIII